MLMDAAFAMMLQGGTCSASPTRRYQRVGVSATGASETPLPEWIGPTSLRQFATRRVGSTRPVLASVSNVADRVMAAGLIAVNVGDEEFVDKLFVESSTKPTTKHPLRRRVTK